MESLSLLRKQELENSPSRRDGIAAEADKNLHRFFARFLFTCGFLLELPIQTTGTAIVFFHLFYSRLSFVHHDPYLCAQACLLLASKSDENVRRVRDVLNVTYRVSHPASVAPATTSEKMTSSTSLATTAASSSPSSSSSAPSGTLPDNCLLHDSGEYWRMKDLVLRFEQKLLRVLSFDMSVTLPHVFVLRLARELEVSDALAGHAFYVANDSLCTRLCLQYKPEKVACAVLHLAAEILGLTGELVAGSCLRLVSASGAAPGAPAPASGSACGPAGPSSSAAAAPHLHRLPRDGEWWERYGVAKHEMDDMCQQLIALYDSPEPAGELVNRVLHPHLHPHLHLHAGAGATAGAQGQGQRQPQARGSAAPSSSARA